MAIVVADTGPIRYLVQIEYIGILPDLFGEGVVPDAVDSELGHPGAPLSVRRWMSEPPPSLRRMADPEELMPLSVALDPGERAAIVLAANARGSLLLVDDRRARSFAASIGVETVGTLGMIDLAARDLGYAPRISIEEGIRRVCSWLASDGSAHA